MSSEQNLSLTEEEITQLSEIDRALMDTKLKLADLEIQLAQANAQKQQLIEQFVRGREAFLERVNYIATLHGLDINGPEKFVLDTSEMTFRKV